MAAQTTPKDLAKVIVNMAYGDLIRVAADFAEMNDDKDIRPKLKTADDFASLLHDWADAQS